MHPAGRASKRPGGQATIDRRRGVRRRVFSLRREQLPKFPWQVNAQLASKEDVAKAKPPEFGKICHQLIRQGWSRCLDLLELASCRSARNGGNQRRTANHCTNGTADRTPVTARPDAVPGHRGSCVSRVVISESRKRYGVGRDLRRISGMGLRWTRAFGRLAGIRTHWRSLTFTEYSLDDSSQTEPAARPKDRERPAPIILTDHAALRRSVAVNEKHGNRPRYVAIFGGGHSLPVPCVPLVDSFRTAPRVNCAVSRHIPQVGGGCGKRQFSVRGGAA
jgi:hypothetical protein